MQKIPFYSLWFDSNPRSTTLLWDVMCIQCSQNSVYTGQLLSKFGLHWSVIGQNSVHWSVIVVEILSMLVNYSGQNSLHWSAIVVKILYTGQLM